MAPGGDNRNRSGFGSDGVLSLSYGPRDGTFGYRRSSGTSMATPHVAGVVALMKSLKPDLTFAEARYAFEISAQPLDASACAASSAYDCGFGLLDAEAALRAVQAGATPPSGGRLLFETPQLSFGLEENLSVVLRNVGSERLDWSLAGLVAAEGNPGPLPLAAVRVTPSRGSLSVNGRATLTIALDRSQIPADGVHAFALIFRVDDANEVLLNGSLYSSANLTPTLTGPLLVGAVRFNLLGQPVASGSFASDSFVTDFEFPVGAGANWLLAWVDENGSGEPDVGDHYGLRSASVWVLPFGRVEDLELLLEPFAGTEPLPGGLAEGEPADLPAGFDLMTLIEVVRDAAGR
jgi:serine protease